MRGIALAAGLLLAGAAHAAGQDTSHIREAEAFVKAAMPECDMNDRSDIPVNLADDSDVSHYVYTLHYRYSFDEPGDPDHSVELYQMFCFMGAYNVQSAFLLRDPDDGTFQLAAFARPNIDYRYAGDDDTRLEAPPVVTGYGADLRLTNAVYDPKTGMLSSHALWRGLGDAWSGGEWKLVDGEFVLTRFEVDPTYDLNADNTPADPYKGYVVVGQ